MGPDDRLEPLARPKEAPPSKEKEGGHHPTEYCAPPLQRTDIIFIFPGSSSFQSSFLI